MNVSLSLLNFLILLSILLSSSFLPLIAQSKNLSINFDYGRISGSDKVKKFEKSLFKNSDDLTTIVDTLIRVFNDTLNSSPKDRLCSAVILASIDHEKAINFSIENINYSFQISIIIDDFQENPFYIPLHNRCSRGDGWGLTPFLLKQLKHKKTQADLYRISRLFIIILKKEMTISLLQSRLDKAYEIERRNLVKILKFLEKY